jgi:hypothetical protein
MEGLSMETVANVENCLFRRFRPFVAFETIQNNVSLHFAILCCEMKKKRVWVLLTKFVFLKASFAENVSLYRSGVLLFSQGQYVRINVAFFPNISSTTVEYF